MRNVLTLFAAVVFLLYSSVLAAAPARACCLDADCPIAQCVATACTPAAMPAAVARITEFAAPAPRTAPTGDSPAIPPHPAKEVWSPPD